MEARNNENKLSFAKMMAVSNRSEKTAKHIIESQQLLESADLTLGLNKIAEIPSDEKTVQELETDRKNLMEQIVKLNALFKTLYNIVVSDEEFKDRYDHLVKVTQEKITVATGKTTETPFFNRITCGAYATLFTPKNEQLQDSEQTTVNALTLSK